MTKKYKKKQKRNTEDIKKVSIYLEIPTTDKEKERKWNIFLENLRIFFKKIHNRGKKKITIMLIPHSESSILSLHLNFYIIFFSSLVILLLTITSIFVIIYRNSQNLQYYHLGVTSNNFYLQTSRLSEEIIPMHNVILQFSETITKIHNNLRLASENGKGGYVNEYTFSQIESLNQMIQECKEKKIIVNNL